MEYKIDVVGYDNCEWGHTNKTLTIEATTKEEAIQKAKEWCKEHFSMGGYEWFVEENKLPPLREVVCPKCNGTNFAIYPPTTCCCCGTEIREF